MVTGTILSQGMVLGAMPLITRLYTPEAIALGALFLSISATVATLATLRLDLAIVLPEADSTAHSLQRLVYRQVAAVACVMGLVLLVAAPRVADHLGPRDAGVTWVWLLIPMVAATAVTQVGIGMATRRGRFKSVVLANLVNSLCFVGVALVVGAWRPGTTTVVGARLTAQVACVVALAFAGCLLWRRLAAPRREGARQLWSEQRQFLIFNTPYSLVSSVSRDLPLFAFAILGEPYLVASYALARTVMTAPATLAAAGLSSVFFRVAARSFGSAKLEKLASTLSTWGLALPLAAFAFVSVWGVDVFELVFGANWGTAGAFAAIIAVPMWLSFQTGWPERLYEVARRQRVSFGIQIAFDITQILALGLTAALSDDPRLLVGAFAAVNATYHLAYLTGVYRVAQFDLRPLVRAVLGNAVAFAAAALAMLALRALGSTGFWLSVLLTTVVTLLVATRLYVTRPLDPSPATSQELA